MMDKKHIDDFDFFQSGEWQALEEMLERDNICPKKEDLFKAFDYCPLDEIKVVICGQDPYPNPDLATGVAFSIPKGQKIPPTLANVLQEYATDLHYPYPEHGDLTKWAERGVLLWNAIPTCRQFKSLSHAHVVEWYYFNKELFETLSNRGIVFVLCGGYARNLVPLINEDESYIIEVTHPSPRANLERKPRQGGTARFVGSRIFSRANAHLTSLGLEPVNWRL